MDVLAAILGQGAQAEEMVCVALTDELAIPQRYRCSNSRREDARGTANPNARRRFALSRPWRSLTVGSSADQEHGQGVSVRVREGAQGTPRRRRWKRLRGQVMQSESRVWTEWVSCRPVQMHEEEFVETTT